MSLTSTDNTARRLPSLNDLSSESVAGRILSTRQSAQYWGVSVPTWRRLCKAGKVPLPIRVGLRKNGWRLNVLDAALKAREAAE
jgi:predicted DNA-binding transcriptional regulator AlpA